MSSQNWFKVIKASLKKDWRSIIQTVFIVVGIMVSYMFGRLGTAYEIATIHNYCTDNPDIEVSVTPSSIEFRPRKILRWNYTMTNGLLDPQMGAPLRDITRSGIPVWEDVVNQPTPDGGVTPVGMGDPQTSGYYLPNGSLRPEFTTTTSTFIGVSGR